MDPERDDYADHDARMPIAEFLVAALRLLGVVIGVIVGVLLIVLVLCTFVVLWDKLPR